MLKSVTIKMKHDENNYSNAQKTSVLFAAILILVPKGHWMALVIDRSSGTRYLIYLWVVCVCVFFLSKKTIGKFGTMKERNIGECLLLYFVSIFIALFCVLCFSSLVLIWLIHFLTYLMPLVSFYTPWKQKTRGFLIFSGGIKNETSGMK